MSDFYLTQMGRTHYERTMPRLAKAAEEQNKLQEKLLELLQKQNELLQKQIELQQKQLEPQAKGQPVADGKEEKPFDILSGARKMAAPAKVVEEAIDKRLDIISAIAKEHESDKENESSLLLDMYLKGDETVKAAVDYTITCICGWSLETIIEKSEPQDE